MGTCEVLKQVAAAAQQQRIIQTGVQWEQAVAREAVVEGVGATQYAGAYNAGVVDVREGTIGATNYVRPAPTGLVEYAQPGTTTLMAPRAASLGTEMLRAPRVATTAPVATTPLMTTEVLAAPLMT